MNSTRCRSWAALLGVTPFLAAAPTPPPHHASPQQSAVSRPWPLPTITNGLADHPSVLPVRTANLTPAVIFADASILSYHIERADQGSAEMRAAVDPGIVTAPTPLAPAAIDACPAEDLGEGASDRESTITLFFAADSGVGHPSEYTLWRQVNDSTPTPLVRHVSHDGRLPFLQYRYVVPNDAGSDSLAVVPRRLLPISRRDTLASTVDVRALRAVEWHFVVPLDSVVDGLRMARVHVVTSLPAIGQLDRHECRDWSASPPAMASREDDSRATDTRTG